MIVVMDDQPWRFDDMRARLLDTVEALNSHIRDVAHAPPSVSAHNGDDGIAQWKQEVTRTIGILEAAKKVILARLGGHRSVGSE